MNFNVSKSPRTIAFTDSEKNKTQHLFKSIRNENFISNAFKHHDFVVFDRLNHLKATLRLNNEDGFHVAGD